jgi:signal transduction histidine kinase/CheY-like chemotaxis protein
MAAKARQAPPAPQNPQDIWRPTGNLSRRMSRLISMTALAAALVVIAVLTLQTVTDQRQALLARVDAAFAAQRELAVASLELGDPAGAERAVRGIGLAAGASSVRMTGLEGTVVASFRQSAAAAAALEPRLPDWQRVALDYLPSIPLPEIRLRHVVDINGDPLGAIEASIPTRPIAHGLFQQLKAALLALLGVLLVAMVIARRMQTQIAGPVRHLLETMDEVAHSQDYSLRATPKGPDEIGSLIVSFNEMLHQIHSRNQRLADHRRKLQELIIERTKSFERAAVEAERASRAKGDFLARMSHEIRTPMNGVVGMAELLENTRLEERQQNMLQTMRSSADSLLSIINDILDFSKIEAGQLQVLETEFSPIDLIEEVCELLAPRAHERNLELICDIDPEVPPACGGDPIRLRQIVTNLLGNAVKYTEKGHIVLRATAVPRQDGKLELKVVVEDTGLGIAEHQLETIFDAFTQGDSFESRKHGGTGLGLAITKQLVAVLGGDIGVTSTLGAGSRFWVTVPLSVASNADTGQPAWDAGVSTALVVLQDELAAKALEKQLAAGGMQVWSCQTGHRALERLTLTSFGLVLVDEALPDMTGYELIARLRSGKATAAIPIVMLTSSKPATAQARASEAQGSPPDARVGRPVRRDQLREAIARAQSGDQGEAAGPAAAASHPALQLKVLLVEDSPVNREVAVGMLQSVGCTVETANDGSIGVEQALSWSYDVILMDCQMPLMDGFEATRRIRAAEAASGRPPMPIIALTANALQGDRERCLEAGMSDFVSKPFTIKKLFEALRAAKLTGKPAAAPAAAEATTAKPRSQDPAEQAPELMLFEDTPAPGQSKNPQELPVIDADRVEELRSLGRPQLVQQAATLFQKQALKDLEELAAALQAGAVADVERTAHSLKSASLSVGGRRFAATASDCEQAARAGDLAAAGQIAIRLRPEFAALCLALVEVQRDGSQAA